MNPLPINALVAAEHSADLQRAAGCCTPVLTHRRTAHATTLRTSRHGLRRTPAVQPVPCACVS